MSIYDTTQPNNLAPTNTEVAPDVNAPMTASQANQILNQYAIDPNQVLSASNIFNTISSPTPAPDDLLGIRKQISDELGLTAQQAAYQKALSAARTRLNDLNKSTALMEGQRVNLGVIRGEQGQARTLAAPEIENLNYQVQLEADRLNALTQERDYRVGVAEKNIDLVRNLKLLTTIQSIQRQKRLKNTQRNKKRKPTKMNSRNNLFLWENLLKVYQQKN
jgi:predicted exporter